MKKFKMYSLFTTLIICIISVCVIQNVDAEGLSWQQAAAYKTVIEQAIERYGIYREDFDGYWGVGHAQLVDFDNDGNEELLIGCGDGSGPFYEVYGYDGNAFEITQQECCASLDLGVSLGIMQRDGITYLVTEEDSLCESVRFVGTVKNKKWYTEEYYCYEFEYGMEEYLELPDRDIFKINGIEVSQEAFNSAYSKILTIYEENSFITYGEGSAQKLLDELNLIVASDFASVKTVKKDISVEVREAYVNELEYMSYLESIGTYQDVGYCIYDIDKNGTPELLIKIGNSEANYYFDVFSYREGTVSKLGNLPGGHIALYESKRKEILLYMAHMGTEMIIQGKVQNNAITTNVIFEYNHGLQDYWFDGNFENYRKSAKHIEINYNVSDVSSIEKYFENNSAYICVEPDVSVELQGKKLEFDTVPIIENGRTLVPIRKIFEELGARVEWNSDTQTVTAFKDGVEISFAVGSNVMYKNGEKVLLEVEPKIINQRTLIPVRAVSEAFGCSVYWDNYNRVIMITK